MADWWEKGYPGGPMVGPAWPRPLYPPDAAPGHTPSADAPDCVALKRALWRGGRWQGPASAFDDSMSNGVSHGKTGGNVISSGVAGFQRQMKIQPTGWVGAETANAIRSARIPDGLPHAGEPLLDETAINLLEDAAKQFSKPKTSVREAALKRAITQLGVTENPYGSNECLYCDWYSMVGPWCAMFSTWSYELAAQGMGLDSPSFVRGSYYAYVPYILSDARTGRRGLSITASPKPGDLVIYDWQADNEPDHVGLYESGSATVWQAIEGNTSPDSGGSQSNGGQVCRRARKSSDGDIHFVRVAEP